MANISYYILKKKLNSCKKCKISLNIHKKTLCLNNFDSNLAIFGEAPGFFEQKHGIPFIGKSGAFLNKRLRNIGIFRDQIYITNIVKCGPKNRAPDEIEIRKCSEFILLELKSLLNNSHKKYVWILLGKTAINFFWDGPHKLRKVFGKPCNLMVINRKIYSLLKTDKQISLIPLYHPSYCIRAITKKRQQEFCNAFKQLKKYLQVHKFTTFK